MFRLLWIASIHTRAFMRRYMPSNIILDRVRTRRGLKWGPLAMLLAVPYAAAAYWLTEFIDAGGPAWLRLVILVCLWSAFKMLWIGPASLLALALASCRGHRSTPLHSVKECRARSHKPRSQQHRIQLPHEALPH
jgi:hypothetical protein